VKIGVFSSETSGTECEMFDDRSGGLTMYLVSIGESIFETGDDGVNVVFTHLTDVLEQERHRFETTVSDIEFGCSVFIQDGGNAGERSTCFGDDGCQENDG